MSPNSLPINVLIFEDESGWVLEQLEELKTFHPIASTFARNLKRVWDFEGDYWTAVRTFAGSQGN